MRHTAAILATAQVALAGLYPGITPYNHSCALCTSKQINHVTAE